MKSSRMLINALLGVFLALFTAVYSTTTFTTEINRRGHKVKRNYRPIIGVLTQDLDFGPEGSFAEDNSRDDDDEKASEYIAASYVKFLEGAGARVVAVRYNQPREDLMELFRKLNGMLLPGGGTALKPGAPFYDAGEALWDFLEEQPDFPIFGTCLGMEFLAALAAGTPNVLHDSGGFDASNSTFNLFLTRYAYESVLFENVVDSDMLLSAVKHKNITYNEHQVGVTPREFDKYRGLRNNFKVIATSIDNSGKEFIAAFEHRSRNIFGVQFHPEKNIFEWFAKGNFPHSLEAVVFAQTLANVFVERTRRNFNNFDLEPADEVTVLIENHEKRFLGNSYFQEAYIFYPHEPQLGLDPDDDDDEEGYTISGGYINLFTKFVVQNFL